jgi:hypothetical protein
MNEKNLMVDIEDEKRNVSRPRETWGDVRDLEI